jgi:Bax protein
LQKSYFLKNIVYYSILLCSLISNTPSFASQVKLNNSCLDFLTELSPAIQISNARILHHRKVLEKQVRNYVRRGRLTKDEWNSLMHLAHKYNLLPEQLEIPMSSSHFIELAWLLSLRIDTVPIKIVLAQAVLESGWGRSESARLTNNFFGITASSSQSGLKVTASASRVYYLKEYPSVEEGIKDYMHILNTYSAYAYFRNLRAAQRFGKLDQLEIALLPGLWKWSERRSKYLDKLQLIIERYLPA